MTLRIILCCFIGAIFNTHEAVGSGVLMPKDGSPPIHVQSHRVTVIVEDGLARTTLRQTFVNPYARPLEAVYVFPLPEDASLVDLAMEVGGQRLEGFLSERQTARRSYNAIKRRGLDPALVEQIGRSTFRLSVFPVLPNQPTVIELSWIESVPLIQGEYRYVYPLALDGKNTETQQDLTVTVNVRSSATIASISSPNEDMFMSIDSEHSASASMEVVGAKLAEDIVVVTRVSTQEPSLGVHTYHPPMGDAYFAAILTPPELLESQIIPRDITLVLDTSGSMKGVKFAQAQSAGLWILKNLRPKDRVNILLFNNEIRSFAESPVPANDDNLDALKAFLENASPGGGTALGDAIQRASEAPKVEGRAAMAVILTDGLPSIGERLPEKIIAFAKEGSARGLRSYTFGVGADVDSALLEGVATAGGGIAEVFRLNGEIEGRLQRFISRTSFPAIVDLKVTLGDRRVDDLLPRPLGDIYLGEQAIFTGRAQGSGIQTLRIQGVLDGEPLTLETEINLDPPKVRLSKTDPIARDLYAHAKLGFLLMAQRLRVGLNDSAYFASLDQGRYSTEDEVISAMIDLSLETGVQCAYTSFIALLPEDHKRLNPRDATALNEAMERAQKRRQEIAGPQVVEAGEISVDDAEKSSGNVGISLGRDLRPPGNPGGPGTPGPGAPQTGARPGAGSTGGPQIPGARASGNRPTAGMSKRSSGGGYDQWEFWWAHNKDAYIDIGSQRSLDSRENLNRAITPALLKILENESYVDIVDSVVLALGRSVDPADASQVLPALIKALTHEASSVKQSATLALGILGSEESRPILLSLMDDTVEGRSHLGIVNKTPSIIRGFAAIGLGLIGDPKDIASLINAVEKSPESERDLISCALMALGMFTSEADKIAPFLLDVMDRGDLDRTLRSLAPIALSRLKGRDAVAALPTLLDKLSNTSTDVGMARSCAIAVGKLASVNDPGVIEALMDLANKSTDQQTMGFSLIALGEIGSRDGENKSRDVEAHAKIHEFLSSGALKPRNLMNQPYASLALSLYARGQVLNPAARDRAIAILIRGFDDVYDPSYKGAMAIALGLLGAKKEAGGILHEEWKRTQNEELGGDLAISLGMMDYDAAGDDLIQGISQVGISFKFRINLARALGLLKSFESVEILIDLMESTSTLSETVAIAQSIGLIGNPKALEPLLKSANDQNRKPLERAFAVSALGLLGEKTPVPWNAGISIGLNYRSKTDAISEILDIL